MMKRILFSLFVVLSFSLVSAQISDAQYQKLIPSIKKEKWDKAYKASEKMLKNAGDENSENACLVRFVNLYAAAGMVKTGKMTFDQLKTVVDLQKGKKIVSPNFVGSMNPQNTLNKTLFSNFDGANKGFTTITDMKGKIILYVDYDIVEKFEPRALHGTLVSCGGLMKEININPEKKTDWILEIKVGEGFIKK